MRLVKCLIYTLFLSACSSIPLSSMIKLASMDDNDITRINPSQVRVRITVNDPAKLHTKDVRLALKFEYAGEGNSEYQFVLRIIDSRQIDATSGWFSSEPNKHQYEFVIADHSVDVFKKYQREFIKYGKPKKYHWTVYYYLKNIPAKDQPIDLDLELKFADNSDYFYLLKGAEIEVN